MRLASDRRTVAAGAFVALLLTAAASRAQPPGNRSTPPTAPAPADAVIKDKLGRDTPRGTLLGFLDAVRKENDEVAPLYLDSVLRGGAAVDLARKLYVVIDTRLPARLSELSDRPEGSLANPLKPDQNVIGTIQTADGPLDLVVERVKRGKEGPIWLFSRNTLEHIPDAYAEVDLVQVDRYLPDVLAKTRLGGVRLFGWLALVVIVPLGYRFFGLVGLLLRPLRAFFHRQSGWIDWPFDILTGPARLFALALSIRWLVSLLQLALRERQFWAVVVTMLSTVAIAWLMLRLNGAGERYIHRQLDRSTAGEMAAILRLVRRAADVLIIAASVLVMVRYFGFDPTAALAGLGIGGIAVALAAQKTLENVIGGLSIVIDKAVRVGDTLKVGETTGTVDYVGLRSTRIRTFDRTVVSVPNGQIANVNIETLSARDKFWFHHFLGLSYEATPSQIRAVVEGVKGLLAGYPGVDPDIIRVRFFRLGPFSLDIEVSAYIAAGDFGSFLEIQQDLLLRVMEIVEREGAVLALPSQTLHVADARTSESTSVVR